MDKSSLEGFANWVLLESCNVSSLPEGQKGVYIFTDNEIIHYLKGKSNILYIGRTDNFRRRIFGNYIGGIGGKTTKRIHNYLFRDKYIERVEVGFKVCEDNRFEEKRLQKVFQRIKGEKPIWNIR